MITTLIASHLLAACFGAALAILGMRAMRSVAVIVEPPCGFDSDPMMGAEASEWRAPLLVRAEDIANPDDWRRYARVGDSNPDGFAQRLPSSGYPLDHQEAQALEAEAVDAAKACEPPAVRPVRPIKWMAPEKYQFPRDRTGD